MRNNNVVVKIRILLGKSVSCYRIVSIEINRVRLLYSVGCGVDHALAIVDTINMDIRESI